MFFITAGFPQVFGSRKLKNVMNKWIIIRFVLAVSVLVYNFLYTRTVAFAVKKLTLNTRLKKT